jgi:oligopeptide/dipeptide ABC transporter ATP-binding protein
VTNNVLEIRDLTVGYQTPRGVVRALNNVNLEVPKGKIVGIVGESGCGKSTLLSSIIGLLDANAHVIKGSVSFAGQNLMELSDHEIRSLRGDRISMIFQDPMSTLNPVLSIGDHMTGIQFRSRISMAKKRERSVKMLGRVGIADAEEHLDSFPHQFSGGMCQRVSIAMALQSEPDLLIADEPTTALDATLEVEILHRLRELQKNLHCSILFISHHLGVISEICDDVYVMYAGEVVESGSVRDIFHNAKHPYSQKLLECDPARATIRTDNLPTLPGNIPDLTNPPVGCIFASRCPDVMETCQTNSPQRLHIGSNHYASCHLLNVETEHA